MTNYYLGERKPKPRLSWFWFGVVTFTALGLWGVASVSGNFRPRPGDSVVSFMYYNENHPAGYQIGTGTFVDGRVLTAAHVVSKASSADGTVGDIWPILDSVGKLHYARIERIDTVHDVAILKLVKDEQVTSASMQCEPAWLGQHITVYGYPIGFGLVVTEGHIVRLTDGKNPWPYGSYWPVEYLFDAFVTHGNSGGPAFADDGRIVGVVVGVTLDPYTQGQIGLNIMVPASVVCDLLLTPAPEV